MREQTATGGDLTSTPNALPATATMPEEEHERLWWQQRHESYWSEISVQYDDLYRSEWSRYENAWVAKRLDFVKNLASPIVVDLGCGTGLGFRLLRQINPTIRYVGVDISTAMVRLASARGEDTGAIVGAMDDLSALADASVDVVLALFTSVSLAYRTSAVLAEVRRVLRPGGHAYLSALSVTSLSRVIRPATPAGFYRTRGDERVGAGVPVRLVSIAGMRRLVAHAGLTTVSVVGMNALSGALEIPQLWHFGRLVAQLCPAAAHTIDVHVRKFG